MLLLLRVECLPADAALEQAHVDGHDAVVEAVREQNSGANLERIDQLN